MILWHICKEKWEWKDYDLYGHYHMGKLACPGDTLQKIIEAVKVSFDNGNKNVYNFNSVKDRQQALSDLEFYQGETDGIWGPASKGALIKFQISAKLAPDGIWSFQTESEINKIL